MDKPSFTKLRKPITIPTDCDGYHVVVTRVGSSIVREARRLAEISPERGMRVQIALEEAWIDARYCTPEKNLRRRLDLVHSSELCGDDCLACHILCTLIPALVQRMQEPANGALPPPMSAWPFVASDEGI